MNEFAPGSGLPKSSDIAVAEKKGTAHFLPLADSADIMKSVNTGSQEYAPATSADERELYFTRADFDKQDFQIMVAKRNSTSGPFGPPETIVSITCTLKEAPTISPDGQCLYYHALDDGKSRIYMVRRLAKTA